MAKRKSQIETHTTKATTRAINVLKRERIVRGLRDALRRIITDWEVSHDIRDAVEHAKEVLAEAQEELK